MRQNTSLHGLGLRVRTLVATIPEALRVGLAINLIVFAVTLPFLALPSTASVRAGGWGLLVFGLACVGLAVGVSSSSRSIRARSWIVGLTGLCLAITPLPLAFVLFQWCARIKGYELAP